ncbi:Flp pilus assembly complex ATPase component TadA [Patescibacteria group bacterium]|nr:Flp pilus assembly complex ATPase component TadA [Patescibacteria group bacterium]
MSQKITHNLFAYARQIEAENLVLTVDEKELKVSYYLSDSSRKDFVLAKKYAKTIKDYILSLISDDDFEPVKIKKKNIYYQNKKFKFEFLLSVVSAGQTEKIIFDFKKKENLKNWRLSETGIKNKDRKTLINLTERGRGLIIISGDKSSGKTSTLLALLNELKDDKKSICLIGETKNNNDLIRMELNSNAFELALKADLDIIAVDEIRNKEDLAQAFRLASYGKLVIITIEAENLKILAKKIKGVSWAETEKIKLIKAISFQKLDKLKRLINNKKDKRQEIARFKLLTFKQ